MELIYFASTVSDGSMKPVNGDGADVRANRKRFLDSKGIDINQSTLLHLTYGGENYTRYLTVDGGLLGDGIVRESTIEVDALVTTDPNHALFLPLADCIGAVIHDPVKNVLMLSHLGRHNLEQQGGAKSIRYLVEKFAVDPKDMTVWLSPAAGQQNYPLFSLDNRGMHDVATEQLIRAGVPESNITRSSSDTTTDDKYFSHSQFLKGNRETDGRFAVVAMMRYFTSR